jgi:hypothetical protein
MKPHTYAITPVMASVYSKQIGVTISPWLHISLYFSSQNISSTLQKSVLHYIGNKNELSASDKNKFSSSNSDSHSYKDSQQPSYSIDILLSKM